VKAFRNVVSQLNDVLSNRATMEGLAQTLAALRRNDSGPIKLNQGAPNFSVYRRLPVPDWSEQHMEAYHHLNADFFVGKQAKVFLLTTAEDINPSSRQQAADRYKSSFDAFVSAIRSLNNGFAGLGVPPDPQLGPHASFVFRDEYPAETLEELERRAKELQRYLNMLSAITGEHQDSYELVRLERGSAILGVGAGFAMLASLVVIVRHGLGMANEALTLRRNIAEIRNSPIGDDDVVAMLETRLNDRLDALIEEAAQEIIEAHAVATEESDLNESRTRARKLLRLTSDMIEKGARIYPRFGDKDHMVLDDQRAEFHELEIQELYKQLDSKKAKIRGLLHHESDDDEA